jgi:hypothetical protein
VSATTQRERKFVRAWADAAHGAKLADRAVLDAREAPRLTPELANAPYTIAFLPVLQLYRALGFDPRQPFRRRLDHKLIQARELRRWAADVAPSTEGLCARYAGLDADELRRRLEVDFPVGFLIKPTLGYASRERSCFDRTEEVLAEMRSGKMILKPLADPVDESYVVQERLRIQVEYRVHTVESSIVETLSTERFKARRLAPDELLPLHGFVRSVIERLPPAMVQSTMCGWDVAKTEAGDYRVIEINYAGIHPVFLPGFQASGFFADRMLGPLCIARLIEFCEHRYKRFIDIQPFCEEHPALEEQYRLIALWRRFERIRGSITGLTAEIESLFGPVNQPSWEISSGQEDGAQRYLRYMMARLQNVQDTTI